MHVGHVKVETMLFPTKRTFHAEMMQVPWQVALVSGVVHTIALALVNEV